MSETPRRRLLDQSGGAPTFVAAGCHLTGDIETPGPVIVCGIVRGDGKGKYKQIRAVLDICQQANVSKVDLATEINK